MVLDPIEEQVPHRRRIGIGINSRYPNYTAVTDLQIIDTPLGSSPKTPDVFVHPVIHPSLLAVSNYPCAADVICSQGVPAGVHLRR